MNKMYLVVDMQSDYEEKMDYKGLKNLLIECIGNDALSNYGEYEIIEDCLREMSKMAKEEYTDLQWIIDLLKSYSYKVIDLLELQRDLEDAKHYFMKDDSFDTVINTINKGV